MKKKTLSILLVLSMVLCLAGCGQEVEDKANKEKEPMFVCIKSTSAWSVVYHRETKVMYVVSNGTNHGIFTLLVDENGNPLLYETDD